MTICIWQILPKTNGAARIMSSHNLAEDTAVPIHPDLLDVFADGGRRQRFVLSSTDGCRAYAEMFGSRLLRVPLGGIQEGSTSMF